MANVLRDACFRFYRPGVVLASTAIAPAAGGGGRWIGKANDGIGDPAAGETGPPLG